MTMLSTARLDKLEHSGSWMAASNPVPVVQSPRHRRPVEDEIQMWFGDVGDREIPVMFSWFFADNVSGILRTRSESAAE